MSGTGANSVPLGPLHPALRGQQKSSGSGHSGESMLNAARLAAARVTANLKPNPNLQLQQPEVKSERPAAAAYRNFPATAEHTPPKRKRRSRWGGDERAALPSLIPSGISAEQEKQVLLHLKVEDLSRKLRSGDLGIPPNAEDRSPSPEPIYDHNGKRLNTREYRTRKRLEEERHNAVQEAMTLNVDYKPPADYKPPVQKISDRVMIPQDDHPHINFVGLLIGPRGNTLKKLEKDTGTKIMIRGKGSIKEGKVGRKDGQPLPGEDEPLHALITASSAESVKKAVDQITQTIKEGIEQPEGQNDLRRKQLRELAKLNGTLREEDMLRCSNCGSTEHRTWQCPEKQNITSNVLCGICGAAGHLTADCRQKANISNPFSNQQTGPPLGGNLERAKMDSEYMSFMAELGEGPTQSSHNKRPINQPPIPPSNSAPPQQSPVPLMNSMNGRPPPLLDTVPTGRTVVQGSDRDDRMTFDRRDSFERRESFGSSRGPNGPSGDRGSYNDNYRGGDKFQGGSSYGDGQRYGGRPRPLMSQSPYSWRREREDEGNFGGPPPRRPPPFGRRVSDGPPPRGMGPRAPMNLRGPPPSRPGSGPPPRSTGGIPPLMHTPPPNLGPPSSMGQPRPPIPIMGYMGGPPQNRMPGGAPPMNVPPWSNAAMPPVPPSSQPPTTGTLAQHIPPPPSHVAQPPPPPPSSDPQPAPPVPTTAGMYQTNTGNVAVSSGGVAMPTQSPWQQMQHQQSVSMATSLATSAPAAAPAAPLYPWQQAAAALAALQQQSTSSAPSSSPTASTLTTATPGMSMAPGATTTQGQPMMSAMMPMGQMPQWPGMMMHPTMTMGMMQGMMMPPQTTPMMQQPTAYQPPPPPIDSNQMASLISAPPPPPPPP